MWMDKSMLRELEALRVATDKGSVADVVRDAVSVYRTLMNASKRGVRLSYENKKAGDAGKVWLLPGPSPFDTD